MRKDLFWGIDLGSCKVSISSVTPETHKVFFSESYDASFLEGGVIKDFYGLVEFLHKIFNDIRYAKNVDVVNVVCSVKTKNITTHKNSFAFALTSERERMINAKDMDYLVEQAILLGQEWDARVIFKMAQYFEVDNSQKVKNPVGLWGRKLKGEVLSLNAPYSFCENLGKVFQYLGVRLAGVISSGLCSFISSKVQEADFIFMDIGYDLTEVLVYRDSVLSDRWIMDFGSSYLDKAISEKFEVPFSLSQKIREDFIDLNQHDNEEILVKIEQSYVNIDAGKVVDTIKEACSYLFDMVKDQCRMRGYQDVFKNSIYVAGGFSLIKGIEDFLMYIAGSRVNIVKEGVSSENEISYVKNSASMGAAIYCAKICKEKEHRGVKKFLHLFKALYADYF